MGHMPMLFDNTPPFPDQNGVILYLISATAGDKIKCQMYTDGGAGSTVFDYGNSQISIVRVE
jgi:hypothetical protein